MIEDKQSNHDLYRFGSAWEEAFAFLASLSTNAPEGRRLIRNPDLYAGIDTYRTKRRDEAKLETHQKYVDIQMLLSGREVIELYPRHELKTIEPYNADRDAEFYHIPSTVSSRILLEPGRFVVFFPDDAHMPCLMAGPQPEEVRKVVVKVALHLLVPRPL